VGFARDVGHEGAGRSVLCPTLAPLASLGLTLALFPPFPCPLPFTESRRMLKLDTQDQHASSDVHARGLQLDQSQDLPGQPRPATGRSDSPTRPSACQRRTHRSFRRDLSYLHRLLHHPSFVHLLTRGSLEGNDAACFERRRRRRHGCGRRRSRDLAPTDRRTGAAHVPARADRGRLVGMEGQGFAEGGGWRRGRRVPHLEMTTSNNKHRISWSVVRH
jgi:hypothetical protein